MGRTESGENLHKSHSTKIVIKKWQVSHAGQQWVVGHGGPLLGKVSLTKALDR